MSEDGHRRPNQIIVPQLQSGSHNEGDEQAETPPSTTRKGGRKKLSRICPFCQKVFTRHNKLTAHVTERRCRRGIESSSSISGSQDQQDQYIDPVDYDVGPSKGCHHSASIFPGRADPDLNETRHILDCTSCWRNIAPDMFSQVWLNQSLLQALKFNNAALIAHLLSAGAQAQYSDGAQSVFQYAVLEGCDSGVVGVLCNAGADPDQLVDAIGGNTALHVACSTMNQLDPSVTTSQILTLLNIGASPEIPNCRMDLPIHTLLYSCPIASGARSSALEALVAKTNARGNYLNHQNLEGSTPLHLAAQHCPLAIPLLLKHRADPNIKNKAGYLPIHLMSSASSLAELVVVTRGGLRAVDDQGFTLLHLAAYRSEADVVRRVLELDKNLVHLRNITGRTGLLTALESHNMVQKRLATARTFIDFGADVNAYDVERNTSLHVAMSSLRFQFDGELFVNEGPDMSDFVRLLIQNGAQVSYRNIRGETPLGILLQNFFRIRDGLWDADCRYNELHNPSTTDILAHSKDERKRIESQRSSLLTEMGELTKFVTILRSHDAMVSSTELEQLSPLLEPSYTLGTAVVSLLSAALTLY